MFAVLSMCLDVRLFFGTHKPDESKDQHRRSKAKVTKGTKVKVGTFSLLYLSNSGPRSKSPGSRSKTKVKVTR